MLSRGKISSIKCYCLANSRTVSVVLNRRTVSIRRRHDIPIRQRRKRREYQSPWCSVSSVSRPARVSFKTTPRIGLVDSSFNFSYAITYRAFRYTHARPSCCWRTILLQTWTVNRTTPIPSIDLTQKTAGDDSSVLVIKLWRRRRPTTSDDDGGAENKHTEPIKRPSNTMT